MENEDDLEYFEEDMNELQDLLLEMRSDGLIDLTPTEDGEDLRVSFTPLGNLYSDLGFLGSEGGLE